MRIDYDVLGIHFEYVCNLNDAVNAVDMMDYKGDRTSETLHGSVSRFYSSRRAWRNYLFHIVEIRNKWGIAFHSRWNFSTMSFSISFLKIAQQKTTKKRLINGYWLDYFCSYHEFTIIIAVECVVCASPGEHLSFPSTFNLYLPNGVSAVDCFWINCLCNFHLIVFVVHTAHKHISEMVHHISQLETLLPADFRMCVVRRRFAVTSFLLLIPFNAKWDCKPLNSGNPSVVRPGEREREGSARSV